MSTAKLKDSKNKILERLSLRNYRIKMSSFVNFEGQEEFYLINATTWGLKEDRPGFFNPVDHGRFSNRVGKD